MKDSILKLIEERKYKPMTAEVMASYFGYDGKELKRTLYEMKMEGLIFEGKKKEILRTSRYGLVKGKVGKFLRRVAVVSYVDEDGVDDDVMIELADLNGALYRDEVLFIMGNNKEGPRVYQVLQPHNEDIVGEFVAGNPSYVIPDNKNYSIEISIANDKTKGAKNGHKVIVDIIERSPRLVGVIRQIIGHKLDPKVDIISKAYEHGVPTKFSQELLDFVATIPEAVSKEDLHNRVDLTNRLIVTIDGADAKDLDDAIDVEIKEDGTFHLGVHIADVSHYVTKNNLLDLEAQKRGTSVYLTDYVIPMLPHALSNGICSLNEQVLRLTMTCEMQIDANGQVIDYDIFPSYIQSARRLTYTQVNELFEKNQSIRPDIDAMLHKAKQLARILRKDMSDRGYLDLDINEAQILVDTQGKPTDVVLRTRGDGEKLIEDFMIKANETVASHIYYQQIPFLYRVHDRPQLKKMSLFASLIEPLGYRIKKDKTGIHPKELQQLLSRIQQPLEKDIIASLMLRSLAKAKYDTHNIGHFGLASQCYTHFTSPIRRYPDLLVHRYLKVYAQPKQNLNYDAIYQELTAFGLSTSIQERRAIELERDVNDMKMAEFMETKIGEIFEGRVNAILKTGFFVELPNTIEGFIRYEDLGDDYYEFDEKRMIALGNSTKKMIKLGDASLIKVKAASKKTGTIDFSLVRWSKRA